MKKFTTEGAEGAEEEVVRSQDPKPPSFLASEPSVLSVVKTFGRMVKFSHTVFALPFALAATAMAARGHGITFTQVAAILVAMAGARTAAMGFNRIVDRRLDARNPRTSGREIGRASCRERV